MPEIEFEHKIAALTQLSTCDLFDPSQEYSHSFGKHLQHEKMQLKPIEQMLANKYDIILNCADDAPYCQLAGQLCQLQSFADCIDN